MAVENVDDVSGKLLTVGGLDGIAVQLEGRGISGIGPSSKGEDLLPGTLDLLELEELLPHGRLEENRELGGETSKGKVHVSVGSLKSSQVADVHVQALSAEVVTLEVTDVKELGRLLGVSDNLGTAVGNATRSVGGGSTRRTTLDSGVGAELGGDTTEAVARAAGVEGARVHASEIPTSLGSGGKLGSWLLRTADGAGDSKGHGVLASAEADGLSELKTVTASKAPGVLVVVEDALLGDSKGLGDGVARISRLDVVGVTASVLVRLRSLVRESASTAANPLLGSKGRAKVLGRVVLVEVGGGNLALGSQRGTAVAGNDLDGLAVSSGGEHVLDTKETGSQLEASGLDLADGQDAEVDALRGGLGDGDAFSVRPRLDGVLGGLEVLNGVDGEEADGLGSLVIGVADLEGLGTLLEASLYRCC